MLVIMSKDRTSLLNRGLTYSLHRAKEIKLAVKALYVVVNSADEHEITSNNVTQLRTRKLI